MMKKWLLRNVIDWMNSGDHAKVNFLLDESLVISCELGLNTNRMTLSANSSVESPL